jgi:phosphate uptake regulator
VKYTRRVQLTGGSTFTVSLPSKWVQRAGLVKGSEIDISEAGITLVLDPRTGEGQQKAKTLSITKDVDDVFLERVLTSIYISYFDILTIKTTKLMEQKIREAVKRFARRVMGVEIFEESSNSIVLQNVLNSDNFTIWNALRRMSLNVETMISDTLQSMKLRDSNMMMNVIERDDEVDRYQWYIFRETKASISMSDNSVYALILSRILERTADHTVNICKILGASEKQSNAAIEKLSDFLEFSLAMYRESMEAFYSKNVDRMNELVEKKQDVYRIKDQILSDPKLKDLPTATAASEEILRIGLYSTDTAELGMDYLLSDVSDFVLK